MLVIGYERATNQAACTREVCGPRDSGKFPEGQAGVPEAMRNLREWREPAKKDVHRFRA